MARVLGKILYTINVTTLDGEWIQHRLDIGIISDYFGKSLMK